MSLFRSKPLAAALMVVAVAACSPGEEPSSQLGDQAPLGETAPEPTMDESAPAAPEGDAAALDAKLVDLGWAGAAATTHAYAAACGATETQLEAHFAAQRKQAEAMGTSTEEFERQFEEGLPLATRRVAIDDVAMAPALRGDTCESILASLE